MMLKNFYEWVEWESIMHTLLFILIIYVLQKMYRNPAELTTTNILLLTVVLSVDLLVHQNINIRNNNEPTYFISPTSPDNLDSSAHP